VLFPCVALRYTMRRSSSSSSPALKELVGNGMWPAADAAPTLAAATKRLR
jgi:hypothetical protein